MTITQHLLLACQFIIIALPTVALVHALPDALASILGMARYREIYRKNEEYLRLVSQRVEFANIFTYRRK